MLCLPSERRKPGDSFRNSQPNFAFNFESCLLNQKQIYYFDKVLIASRQITAITVNTNRLYAPPRINGVTLSGY